jgi:hypothetical protein
LSALLLLPPLLLLGHFTYDAVLLGESLLWDRFDVRFELECLGEEVLIYTSPA